MQQNQVTEIEQPMQQNQADTLATVHFMLDHKATAENFNNARQLLYKLGIKTSNDDKRMIFSTAHSQKNQMSSVFAQECNGLILELGTWKPLMVPPRSLRFNIDTDTSNRFLHQGLYHIYKAEDGTCFNMYYLDQWVISTAKGYNMNNVKWEDKTYQELISECLAKYNYTWETFTALLDKSKCYSFGFKHPNFHHFNPLGANTHKLWFIQSVDLNTESQTYLWASDELPNLLKVDTQVLYNEPVGLLRDLYRLASNSLDDYIEKCNVINHVTTNTSSEQKDQKDQKEQENKTVDACYGYILRSVNFEATGFHSDLFIESSLMRTIRRIWYDNTIIDLCHDRQWSKELVVTLGCYLDSNTREIFSILFPQYQSKFEHYNTNITKLVDEMINLVGQTDVVEPNKLHHTAKVLLDVFTKTIKYNLSSKNLDTRRRVLLGFVNDVTNLDVLMPFFQDLLNE